MEEIQFILNDNMLFAINEYHRGNIEAFKSHINISLQESALNDTSEFQYNINQLHNKLCSLLCLAFHAIAQGDSEKEARKSAFSYDEAANILNECERISSEHPLLWIAKGLLIFSRNRILRERHAYESAKAHFMFVLERYPELPSAILGKAMSEFSLGDYREAIKDFKRILFIEGSKNCDPGIRTALGLCFFNLSDFESAKSCFQRRINLKDHPPCSFAFVALAMIEKERNPASDEYLSFLKSAYSISKSNPLVLNTLAEYFLKKEEYQKAEALALNALNYGFSDKIKTESCYILGKVYHSQTNFDDAYAYYLQTTRFEPEFAPAHFGLGQLYIQKKDYVTAIAALERALELCPEHPLALKISSFLYALNLKDRKKAIKNLKLLLSVDPTDVEAILKLTSLIEQSYPEEAINLYEKAFLILKESSISIPTELHINLAILIMNEDPNRSLLLLQEAKENINVEDNLLIGTSIDYSIGRALETLGKYKEAMEIYKSLISLNLSKQILSHVRLGFISMEIGDTSASDHFKDAIGLDESCKEAWAGLALIHLKSKAITLARKTFERILSKIDKHDLFSLLSLGNIHLVIAKHEQKSNQGSWEASLSRAIEFFQKCLMLDGNNYYAVNGMAIAVAMKGLSFVSGARDAFLVIRQEEPNFIDAWINLAHTYMEEQHFAAAQGIYEHCWKKITTEKKELLSKDRLIGDKEKLISELALYIAKSFYLTGKTVKDRVAFSKSIEWIASIIPITEEEKIILNFNEAITRQEYSACILQSDISSRTFDDVKSALENLDKAVLIFEKLCIAVNEKMASSTSMSIDIKMTRQRIKYCHSLKTTAQKRYEEQLEQEKLIKKSQEEYERMLADAELKKQEEEKLLRESYEEEQKKIEELRRITRERLAEAQAKWKSEASDYVDDVKKKRVDRRSKKTSKLTNYSSDEENEHSRDEIDIAYSENRMELDSSKGIEEKISPKNFIKDSISKDSMDDFSFENTLTSSEKNVNLDSTDYHKLLSGSNTPSEGLPIDITNESVISSDKDKDILMETNFDNSHEDDVLLTVNR